ncbi:zinc finger protein 62 isoform X5 [Spodoptera frugiperda]|uniref:Zinc finger protein 62 isoform X5 n=1 Tax=Spodoptera frugiperda TaxID=7108 RepID=A0A9R0E626_SPOFR|nr:zinc finger protein 62 isoform X5 [Spodoptera frugiperda]
MEFNEIVVKESPGLCRCCLSEGCYKDLGTEYTWMNETEVYADMLLECFDISITQHNEGPNGPNRLICEVCITRLRDACNFKKQVMDSEKKFIDMMGRGEFRPKMLIYQTQMKCEDAAVEQIENANVEYLEDEIEFGDDDLLKDSDSVEASVSDITVSALPIKGKRGRPRKATPVKPEKRAKVAKIEDKPKTSKAVAKERTQDNYIDRLCRKRRNVLQILHYGNVIPFNWHTKGFRCFYCSKPMRDCETLKEHTTKHIVDLPSFIAKSIISKDIPVKLDVSNLSCKLCIGTSIQNLEELITHIVEVHEEEYDRTLGVCAFPFVLTKDIMQCVLCKNMYDNFTCMVGHMYKDHINHSFICQICGYSFITKIRLKRHINNSHVGFRCSVCGKMFNAAHRLIKHKEKIHGQANTRECNLCSATFESQYLLKVHLGKMHNVEKYRIKCEYCPKVCSTKGAMILHVQSQHSESKFECDLCNYKTGIKWLITLHKKKHFGDRDYACSICEKMFRRSSNLRSHMKVHSGTSGRVCRLCRRGFVDLDTLNAHKSECHYLEDA